MDKHYADLAIPSAAIAQMLGKYISSVRHPDLPKIQVSDLTPINQALTADQRNSGVYAFYRSDKTLIYIGMSRQNVAGRVSNHLRENVQISKFWVGKTPALVQIILVPAPWEAPGLEAFLVHCASTYTGL